MWRPARIAYSQWIQPVRVLHAVPMENCKGAHATMLPSGLKYGCGRYVRLLHKSDRPS